MGNNKEETNPDPNNPKWAPTQPLQRCWDVPGGVKSKRKLLWSINTHFPYTTNKLQQYPAGYFQFITSFLPYPSAKIRYSLEKLLPKRTHGRHQQPEQGAGKGSPGARDAPTIPDPGISISFLEQSKPDANSSSFHASAGIGVSTLNPTTSKRFFINKKVCQALGRARVTFPSAFAKHPVRFFIFCSLRRLHISPTSGMSEWHPLNQRAKESIIPLSPQQKGKGNRRCELLSARPSAF